MNKQNYILLRNIDVNEHVIVYHFETSNQLEQYFTTNQFFVEYSHDMTKVPKTFLNI